MVDVEKNRQLLCKEYCVFLDVSTAVQITRSSRNFAPLLPISNAADFFTGLHLARDGLYQQVAKLTIQGDDAALEEHSRHIIQAIYGSEPIISPALNLDNKDLTLFHKQHHNAVQLSPQQAIYLKLLAQGKSAKEIAREMDVSYRTVEGTIARIMEVLGCSSSKELIALYLEQP